jgi:hypothetical protein
MKLIEKDTYEKKSIIFLLIPNIIAAIFAVFNNWNLYEVLWIYYFQFAFIGFFKIIFIFTSKDKIIAKSRFTKFAIGYFLLMFYFVFLFMFFTSLETRPPNLTFMDIMLIVTAILLFFLTHLFSFINYRRKQITLDRVLKRHLFIRIFPMWFILILASGIEPSTASENSAILYGFIFGKTIVDIFTRILE